MDNRFIVGQDAYVTGWGSLTGGVTDDDYPDTLYEAVVPIYDWDKCYQSLEDEGTVTKNMICAGFDEGGADACQGDSGGPLVAYPLNDTRQYYQIGIVSWGNNCSLPYSPGVYTKVTRYEEWIKSALNNPSQISYVGCVNGIGTQGQGMSSSMIAAISVLSVLLAISISFNIGLGVCMYRK